MPKLYLDTNILLDITLKRPPFLAPAKRLLDFIDAGGAEAFTSVLCLVHAHYQMRKAYQDEQKTRSVLAGLFPFVHPVDIPADVTQNALTSVHITDFEDAEQWAICQHHGIDFLITRNQKDFPTSGGITVCDAETYLLLHA